MQMMIAMVVVVVVVVVVQQSPDDDWSVCGDIAAEERESVDAAGVYFRDARGQEVGCERRVRCGKAEEGGGGAGVGHEGGGRGG